MKQTWFFEKTSKTTRKTDKEKEARQISHIRNETGGRVSLQNLQTSKDNKGILSKEKGIMREYSTYINLTS